MPYLSIIDLFGDCSPFVLLNRFFFRVLSDAELEASGTLLANILKGITRWCARMGGAGGLELGRYIRRATVTKFGNLKGGRTRRYLERGGTAAIDPEKFGHVVRFCEYFGVASGYGTARCSNADADADAFTRPFPSGFFGSFGGLRTGRCPFSFSYLRVGAARDPRLVY
jgi:hypothetical protein